MVELVGRYSKLSTLPDFGHIATESRRPVRAARRIHSAHRRLGSDVIAQLVTDYQAGQPTTELMAAYGLGKGTVLGLLHGAGVKLRSQGQRNIELAQAIERYQSGWSLAKLAVAYDCNAETVRTAFKAAGVIMRGPHERQ